MKDRRQDSPVPSHQNPSKVSGKQTDKNKGFPNRGKGNSGSHKSNRSGGGIMKC